ncbi:ABC transporter ATP-binding protein [Lysinibacillus sp. NPDC092081]|uniref:ABC transporter ATP-binding protein n=1 Tax=Lysinibacillus sp. NPDC092081 TaxID=3364131 RepID=UPI00381891D1
MIKMNDVTFSYGNEDVNFGNEVAVSNIQLTVKTGQCVVLCGRSGSGKSTIMRLLSGLAPSFYNGSISGKITVNGLNPSNLLPEERTRLLGVVFQDPRSQFFMDNVLDEIAFSAENIGIAPDEIIRRVEIQAKLLNVEHLLGRSLNMLSSGQKQLVAIAAASILSPPVLLLDEPTANLDQKAIQTLIEMLHKLKQNGTTLLIGEHRLHPLLSIADSFVYMEKGKIVKTWTKEQFSQLTYEEVRPYGLRHPDMFNIKSMRKLDEIPTTEIALEGQKLSYRYRRNDVVIKDLDIILPKGSVTALMGENGAGKTTLCKILCGLLQQRKGIVFSKGIPSSAGQRRTFSYFVMQDADYQLYADSVGNEIVLGRHLDDELRLRAREAMEAFGLLRLQERHPASLSGGEKQRVTMAAASCSDAELIVLDEPTSGLDGDGVLKVVKWVKKLAHAGKTVVIITHDCILSELASDQIKVLKNFNE